MRKRIFGLPCGLLVIMAACLVSSAMAQQTGRNKDNDGAPPVLTPKVPKADSPASAGLEDSGADPKVKRPPQTGDKLSVEKKVGPPSLATKCGPRARSTWKRIGGWGAIAVGDADCGFSWGFRDKARAEWGAMDACGKKTANCRIVEYSP